MKILFLDIDGVLNSSASVLATVEPTAARWYAWCGLESYFNEVGYLPRFTFDTIDPVAVGLINRLLKRDEELKIVLSSSHRTLFCGDKFQLIEPFRRHASSTGLIDFGSALHIDLLVLYLQALGLNVTADTLYDVTLVLNQPRGLEIKQWLDNCPYPIEDYVVLDDNSDIQPHVPNHVQPTDGLNAAHYYELCRHLNMSESKIIISGKSA